MNLSNPSGNWLISIYVISSICNYTKTIIYLTLIEYYTMILTSATYEGSLKETLYKVNLDILIAIKY